MEGRRAPRHFFFLSAVSAVALWRCYCPRFDLYWTQFDRVAVRVADEELRIARAAAAVADRDAHLAQLSFCRLNVGNAERDVAVVARRVGVAGHVVDTHQVKLLPIAQIVPASRETQIGTRQGFQSERAFVKARRAFDVGHEKSGVMKTGDGYRHNYSPFV